MYNINLFFKGKYKITQAFVKIYDLTAKKFDKTLDVEFSSPKSLQWNKMKVLSHKKHIYLKYIGK